MKIDTEILCSFIDGELDEQTAAAVQVALETDENLRREYEDLRKTAELVRGLPKVPAPAGLAATIRTHIEREQLFGPAQPKRANRSRLYWSLSVAASLLVGVSLGILGYESWLGKPGALEPAHGPALLASSDDYSGQDAPAMALNARETTLPKASRSRGTSARDIVAKSGEEIAARAKSSLSRTVGKAGRRIARSGPKKGSPIAKSVGSAQGPVADALSPDGAMDQGQRAQQIRTRSAEAQPESAQMQQSLDRSLGFGVHGSHTQDKADRVDRLKESVVREEESRIVVARLPLEKQVRTNNFLNRDMAANLDFKAEPINVKVISNNSAKTLQYVREWASKNSLVNLTYAPPKMNFPVYTQAIYHGLPVNNAVLVRTTRAQAQQMVNELQQQKPVVVSVSVKDEKKVLGDVLDQGQMVQQGAGWFGYQLVDKAADKETDLEAKEQQKLTEVGEQAETADQRYLFSLSNQAQAASLKDLVSLVVLVEDAVAPTKAKAVQPVEGKAGVPVAAIFSQPQRVASALVNHGYTPSGWKKTFGTDQYQSLAERQITRSTHSGVVGDVPNDITYFVDSGSPNAPNYVARLRLTANVLNTEKAIPVLNEFQKLIPVLFSSLGLQTPKGLSTSIDSQQHFAAELFYGTVSFNREKYRIGYGLVLELNVATEEGKK